MAVEATDVEVDGGKCERVSVEELSFGLLPLMSFHQGEQPQQLMTV